MQTGHIDDSIFFYTHQKQQKKNFGEKKIFTASYKKKTSKYLTQAIGA